MKRGDFLSIRRLKQLERNIRARLSYTKKVKNLEFELIPGDEFHLRATKKEDFFELSLVLFGATDEFVRVLSAALGKECHQRRTMECWWTFQRNTPLDNEAIKAIYILVEHGFVEFVDEEKVGIVSKGLLLNERASPDDGS